MKRFALLAPLLLAGCAMSREDLQRQPPTLTFKTTAKLEDIRDCLAKAEVVSPRVIPMGKGWSISANVGPLNEGSLWQVDLQPEGDNTSVVARDPGTLDGRLSGHFTWNKDVMPCLDKLPKV